MCNNIASFFACTYMVMSYTESKLKWGYKLTKKVIKLTKEQMGFNKA